MATHSYLSYRQSYPPLRVLRVLRVQAKALHGIRRRRQPHQHPEGRLVPARPVPCAFHAQGLEATGQVHAQHGLGGRGGRRPSKKIWRNVGNTWKYYMKNGGKIVKSIFRKIGIKDHPENRGKREFTMGKIGKSPKKKLWFWLERFWSSPTEMVRKSRFYP